MATVTNKEQSEYLELLALKLLVMFTHGGIRNMHIEKTLKGGLRLLLNQYCAFLAIVIMGATAAINIIWVPKSLNDLTERKL